MTMTGARGSSGMAVAVARRISGERVAVGPTVGDGLKAIVGTSMVGTVCVVGGTTVGESEHANPAKIVNKTLMVKIRRRLMLNKYSNFKRGPLCSGRAGPFPG